MTALQTLENMSLLAIESLPAEQLNSLSTIIVVSDGIKQFYLAQAGLELMM